MSAAVFTNGDRQIRGKNQDFLQNVSQRDRVAYASMLTTKLRTHEKKESISLVYRQQVRQWKKVDKQNKRNDNGKISDNNIARHKKVIVYNNHLLTDI